MLKSLFIKCQHFSCLFRDDGFLKSLKLSFIGLVFYFWNIRKVERRFQKLQDFDIDWKWAKNQTNWYTYALVHKLNRPAKNLLGGLVRIYFITREEVNRSSIVCDFDIVVVTNQETWLCQLKYVLNAANWTSYLTRGNVLHVLTVCDWSFLNVLHDAIFTHTVATVQNPWKISGTASNRIVIWILKIADNAASKISFYKKCLQILQTTAKNSLRNWLKSI
jgi:hypothetical protein